MELKKDIQEAQVKDIRVTKKIKKKWIIFFLEMRKILRESKTIKNE